MENILRNIKYKDLNQWIRENMAIVCDTREKSNMHIIGAFQERRCKYTIQCLETGDYACQIQDVIYTDLLIERKNSLNELSANVTTFRERFERELQRAKEKGSKLILLVEDDNFNQVYNHEYQSKLNPTALLATIFTYQERYGIDYASISRKNIGPWIYARFYYHIRERWKRANECKEAV